jgi:N-acetylglutamate synthase-like GNAT family acetyltransferase
MSKSEGKANSTPSKELNKKFLEAIYKNFQMVTFEDEVFYHYWKGPKESVAKYFEYFSFPRIIDLIKLMKMPNEIYVLVSSNLSKNEVYGSCILKINEKRQLQPVTFVINPSFRKMGYGSRLLLQLDQFAQKLQLKEICIKYRTFWKSNEYWDKMLQSANWSAPEIILNYFSLPDINTQYEKDWFKQSQLPREYQVTTWNNQTFKTLNNLLQRLEWRDVVPKDLSPFQFPEKILDYCSLLLHKNGEIVGWLICHLLQPDTAQVTTLFIHPQKSKGISLSFIAEAMKRRKEGLRVVFMVKRDNTKVLNMVNKYLNVSTLEVSHQLKRTKTLA